MNVLLELKKLKYKKLCKLNFKIVENAFISIIGPNDSGKEYLMEALNDIKVVGEKFYNETFLVTCVDDYVFMGEYVSDIIKIYNKESIALDFLKCVDSLYIKNKKISLLSSYEKQLIIVLEAVLSNFSILVFDNSINNIDPYVKNKVLDYLRKKANKTVISFTTNTEEVLFGSEICIFNNFTIIKQGKTKTVLSDEVVFESNNLRLPFIIELSSKLEIYNLINKKYLSKIKMVNDLWK